MTDSREALTEWLRAEFTAEQESGFPRLRRVPDTQVVHFLDRFGELECDEQAELIATLVEWSSYQLLGAPLPNPTYERFRQASAWPGHHRGVRYTDLNLIAGLAKESKQATILDRFQSLGASGLALVPPENLVRDIADLVPIKPAPLRRRINAAFGDLFATQVKDMGSEIWRYEGVLNDSLLKLDVRFSGRMLRPQLSYSALVISNERVVAPCLCFESALGVGFGMWNYITVENAERSIKLLVELVEWLSQLPNRLPESYGNARQL